MKSVANNSKTIKSVDFSTICPKRRCGDECIYCYVKSARDIGFNAKKEHDYVPYNGEILRLSQKMVDNLNAVGGIRFFSFGDYMAEHDNDINQALEHCIHRNLKAKAITKVPEFVIKYGNHPAISVINVSIDNVGHGVNHELACELRIAFPKVKIRCVVLNDADVEAMENITDVFTFNHASNIVKLGYKLYKKADLVEWNKKLDGRVCCVTGHCITCKLKCGA
jgi:hypothetical protein